jgi:hypothetical protein
LRNKLLRHFYAKMINILLMIINASLSGNGDEYKFELVQAIKKLRVAKVSDGIS